MKAELWAEPLWLMGRAIVLVAVKPRQGLGTASGREEGLRREAGASGTRLPR